MNNPWKIGLMVGLFLAVLPCASCRRPTGNAVNVVGSTSIQPFAEMANQEFEQIHPSLKVEVMGGGSTAGLQAVDEGMAEIGMCSRDLKPDECKKYSGTPIALDGLAIVVHPDNKVASVSLEQAASLFAGDIPGWSGLGGADRLVRVITREEGSGTREAFMKKVMEEPRDHAIKALKKSLAQARKDGDARAARTLDARIRDLKAKSTRISRKAVTQESNGAVIALVRGNPDAVGYISLGLVKQSGLKALAIRIDGKVVPAEQHNVTSGAYPLSRPFLFVTKKNAKLSPVASEFVKYVLSEKGQALLEREGLIRTPKSGGCP